MGMSREQKLKAVSDAFVNTAKDFDGLTDEEEATIMDAVQTALNKN